MWMPPGPGQIVPGAACQCSNGPGGMKNPMMFELGRKYSSPVELNYYLHILRKSTFNHRLVVCIEYYSENFPHHMLRLPYVWSLH
jgi:hypothetical protein